MNEIKYAFYTEESIAWRQFIEWRHLPGETVDVYLADLRKLSVPFGGVNNRILACAFLECLPIDVIQLLRISSKMGKMVID